MDEQTAIQQLRNGDIRGLEFLVERYQVRAVRTAYLITRDPGLAEDVVQDCFLRAYRGIRSFDAGRPFEPWFLRSVVNASVKLVQKSRRYVGVEDKSAEAAFSRMAGQIASVETQVEAVEVQQRLWGAMENLSPRQRAVIVQRYYLQMSEQEMATQAGAATGTIKWLLNAARRRLRRLLVERSDE